MAALGWLLNLDFAGSGLVVALVSSPFSATGESGITKATGETGQTRATGERGATKAEKD